MDCKNARLLFDFARPGPEELAPEEAALLKQHVEACADCQETLRSEHCLDEAIGRVVRDVPVPDGLRMRLLGRLQQERDRLYRRLFWRVAAAAAAVVLLIGGVTWWVSTFTAPASLDVASLQKEAYDRREAHLETVNDWLATVSRHPTLEAPADFNYTLLYDYKVTDLQDHQVPTLFFWDRDGKSLAWVYILDRQHFDVEAIKAQSKSNASLKSGPIKVAVLTYPGNPDLVYVVVYTSNNLRPFLRKEQGPNV